MSTLLVRKNGVPSSWLSVLQVLLVMMTCLVVHVSGTNEEGLAFLEENKGKEGVVRLPSGLQYKILNKGRGPAHPMVDSSCSCHYEGKLIDGSVFDSSYERGEPTTFAPNQVITGWTEAMQLMVAGDKWELYIPSDLGYGEQGSPPKIGGGDVLVFQLEMLAILGGTVPALSCQVDADMTDCNEREQTYIVKVQAWTTVKQTKELGRVRTILENPMSDDLRDWGRRRAHILELVSSSLSSEAKPEL